MIQDDGIKLGPNNRVIAAEQSAGAVRWRLIVVILMRVLSVVWMLRALLAWADILGAQPGPAFVTQPLRVQAIICVFAVLNCAVSVGLWLAASWGAALWLLMTAGEILIERFVPESGVTSPPIIAAAIACAVLYALFSYLGRRASR